MGNTRIILALNLGTEMIDYEHWKRIFVRSELTLSQLSKMPNAPSIASLKNRSRSEGWVSQRETHRLAKSLKTNESETVARQADAAIVAINSQVSRVSEILKTLSRVEKVSNAMLYRPIERFSNLNMEELSARDIAAFVRLGWEIKKDLIEIEAARINWESPQVREAIG